MGQISGPDAGGCAINGADLAARRARALSGIVGVAVVLALVLTSCGSDLPEMQAIVDAFDTPADWEEITDSNYSGVFRTGLCVGPIDCRERVVQQWRIPKELSLERLTELAENEGWKNIEIFIGCGEYSRGCTLTATHDGIEVSFGYRSSSGWWVARLAAG